MGESTSERASNVQAAAPNKLGPQIIKPTIHHCFSQATQSCTLLRLLFRTLALALAFTLRLRLRLRLTLALNFRLLLHYFTLIDKSNSRSSRNTKANTLLVAQLSIGSHLMDLSLANNDLPPLTQRIEID